MRRKMLTKLSSKMRDEYMPHIRRLFAKADTDKSGDLDRMEFEVFYPELRDYLGCVTTFVSYLMALASAFVRTFF